MRIREKKSINSGFDGDCLGADKRLAVLLRQKENGGTTTRKPGEGVRFWRVLTQIEWEPPTLLLLCTTHSF